MAYNVYSVFLLFSFVFQGSKFVSKRTACLIATEPPPAATEEPEMDLPKEIFLKDYKKPDYLFDTVTQLSKCIQRTAFSICASILGYFQLLWHMGCFCSSSQILLERSAGV